MEPVVSSNIREGRCCVLLEQFLGRPTIFFKVEQPIVLPNLQRKPSSNHQIHNTVYMKELFFNIIHLDYYIFFLKTGQTLTLLDSENNKNHSFLGVGEK
jgi:hypothetical protein